MDQYIGMITATVAVCAAAAAAGAAMCRSAKKREEGTVIHGRSFCAMCCSGAVGAAAFALTVITGFIPGVGYGIGDTACGGACLLRAVYLPPCK